MRYSVLWNTVRFGTVGMQRFSNVLCERACPECSWAWRPTQGDEKSGRTVTMSPAWKGKGPLRSGSVEAVPESDLECAFLSQ